LNIVDFVAANNKRIAAAKTIATTSPLLRFAPRYRRELKGADGFMTRSRFAALAVGAASLVAGTMRKVQVREQLLRCLIPDQRPEDVKHRPMGSSRDARSPLTSWHGTPASEGDPVVSPDDVDGSNFEIASGNA
jgi:hypothetical protein